MLLSNSLSSRLPEDLLPVFLSTAGAFWIVVLLFAGLRASPPLVAVAGFGVLFFWSDLKSAALGIANSRQFLGMAMAAAMGALVAQLLAARERFPATSRVACPGFGLARAWSSPNAMALCEALALREDAISRKPGGRIAVLACHPMSTFGALFALLLAIPGLGCWAFPVAACVAAAVQTAERSRLGENRLANILRLPRNALNSDDIRLLPHSESDLIRCAAMRRDAEWPLVGGIVFLLGIVGPNFLRETFAGGPRPSALESVVALLFVACAATATLAAARVAATSLAVASLARAVNRLTGRAYPDPPNAATIAWFAANMAATAVTHYALDASERPSEWGQAVLNAWICTTSVALFVAHCRWFRIHADAFCQAMGMGIAEPQS